MQPIKYLTKWLYEHTSDKHYLFKTSDLRALFPNLSVASFKTLLSRSVSKGLLLRVCRGIYLFEKAMPRDGLLLFRVASLIRSHQFNYISLETVLSDAGIISQMPINRIYLASSGSTGIVSCGKFGTIEFAHTNQRPADIKDQLIYNHSRGLWQANIQQSIRDMKYMQRDCQLIDWEVANELI